MVGFGGMDFGVFGFLDFWDLGRFDAGFGFDGVLRVAVLLVVCGIWFWICGMLLGWWVLVLVALGGIWFCWLP